MLGKMYYYIKRVYLVGFDEWSNVSSTLSYAQQE